MHNFIYRNKIPCNNLFKEPLTFVNLLDTSKHIVLYYTNSKFGKIVQFEFIKQGLLKGEMVFIVFLIMRAKAKLKMRCTNMELMLNILSKEIY
jgi:hypothetical protein